jgi:glutathione S-transferase
MIELFHADASTCSQKVRICLAEKNLDYVDRQISLAKFEHLAPEYLAINPNGVVPALRHDGTVIIESTVMCEYLDEVFPAPALTPQDAAGRAHMRAWLRFIDEVPSMAVRVPTFQRLILPSYQKLSKERFDELADSMPLRKNFIMRMGQDGFSDADYKGSIEQLDRSLKRMEQGLAHGPWLLGAQFTIADICFAPLLHRMAELGMAAMWKADAPRVTAWYQRIRERPSFARAFYPKARMAYYFPQLEQVQDQD